MAVVLAFPLSRRVRLIRRLANRISDMSARGAEQTLFCQMQIQRDALLSKGVAPATVDQQVRSLEGAIRAELWRIVLLPGGAA